MVPVKKLQPPIGGVHTFEEAREFFKYAPNNAVLVCLDSKTMTFVYCHNLAEADMFYNKKGE